VLIWLPLTWDSGQNPPLLPHFIALVRVAIVRPFPVVGCKNPPTLFLEDARRLLRFPLPPSSGPSWQNVKRLLRPSEEDNSLPSGSCPFVWKVFGSSPPFFSIPWLMTLGRPVFFGVKAPRWILYLSFSSRLDDPLSVCSHLCIRVRHLSPLF